MFTSKPLSADTWEDFAALVERHNGVWGGCWCVGFHGKFSGTAEGNKAVKHQMVCASETHSSLVYDGDRAIGWCQFGRPADLPKIKHRKRYFEVEEPVPDWRITCFFVDKQYRGKGVSAVALQGALDQIAQMGGGLVESFPEDTAGRKTSGAFLYNSSLSVFERAGFQRVRQLGMHHWLVRRTIDPT